VPFDLKWGDTTARKREAPFIESLLHSAILPSRVSGKRNFDGQMFNNNLVLYLTTRHTTDGLYWRSFALHFKTEQM
jgi:hypothetical protein